MRVTSKAGTELVCPLGEFPAISEYGFVDEPGRWDHWPSGFVLTFPNESQASGQIVIDATNDFEPSDLNGRTSSEVVADLVHGARVQPKVLRAHEGLAGQLQQNSAEAQPTAYQA